MTTKTAEFLSQNSKTAAFVCGLITVGALPPFSFIPCVFLGFSGLIFLLNLITGKKRAALTGFWFAAGYFALGLLWVSNAMLIDGMDMEALAPLPPLGFGLWGGCFGAMAAFIACFYAKGVRRLVAFAAAWGVTEWVRAWFLTGFPWNPVGSVWSFSPVMLQSASVWGVYGLSVVTVLVAGLPALVDGRTFKALRPLFACVCLLGVLYGFGAWRLHHAPAIDDTVNGVRVRLVQANIPQGKKWRRDEAERNLMKHVHLSRSAGAEKVSHVIWPETATQFLLAQDEFARGMVTSALMPSAILMAGSLRVETDAESKRRTYYNSIIVLNDLGVLLGSYDKSHLVPFGEYVPLASVLPFIRTVAQIPMDFGTGNGVRTLAVPRTLPVGMLVCYEVIFPANVVDKRVRPYWLVNATNDGWYGISAGPYQHFAAAQMRAVEEGLPVARAANTGISGMIDAYGRVTASLDLGQEGVVDAGLPRRTEKPTLYADFGNAVVLMLSVLLMIMAALPRRKRENVQ